MRLTGAFFAFIIGAAFATGQEALQFFASHGLWGLGGIAIFCVPSCYLMAKLLIDGKEHSLRDPDQIFRHYLGNGLGRVFALYVTVVSISVFLVMLAGAGSVLNGLVGLPVWAGSGIMAASVLGAVYLGLHSLVAIISRIGPVLILAILGVAIGALLNAPISIGEGHTIALKTDTLRAQPTWWMSGGIYTAMYAPLLYPFLTPIGQDATNRREIIKASIIAPLVSSGTLVLVMLAILTRMPDISGADLPMIYLASSLSPTLAAIYGIFLFLGIFTTATPLLWIALSRLSEDGSQRYRRLAVLVTLVAYVVGLTLPFKELVHHIYPTIGYSGLFLMAALIVKQVRAKSFL